MRANRDDEEMAVRVLGTQAMRPPLKVRFLAGKRNLGRLASERIQVRCAPRSSEAFPRRRGAQECERCLVFLLVTSRRAPEWSCGMILGLVTSRRPTSQVTPLLGAALMPAPRKRVRKPTKTMVATILFHHDRACPHAAAIATTAGGGKGGAPLGR